MFTFQRSGNQSAKLSSYMKPEILNLRNDTYIKHKFRPYCFQIRLANTLASCHFVSFMSNCANYSTNYLTNQ